MTNESSAFISPVLGPVIASGVRAAGQSRNPVVSGAGRVIENFNNMSPDKKAYLINAGKSAISGLGNKMPRGQRMKLGSRRGGGNGSVNIPQSSSSNSGYALSPAPNPMPVSLNSGIQPNTYTSDYMEAMENKCSPLHMNCINFSIPADTFTLGAFFKSIIAFEFQSRAQAAVSFNINITSIFTTANILTAMNAILDAIQIYYWYSSILTYHSDPLNKNEGMIWLRQQITATDMENYYILKKRLEGTPIPPKMLELVRYLYSNFYSGPTQGSPILKLAPKAFTTIGIAGSSLTTAVTNLDASSNNEVYSIIRKCIPSWVKKELPDVPVGPCYDPNFLTIFYNLPFKVWNGTTDVNYPVAATADTAIDYCSWTNNLDGVAFALTGVYTSPNYQPGLISAIKGALGSSRVSYYTVSSTPGLYDSNALPFLVRSRNDTYYVSNTATYAVSSAHVPGTDKCQQVSWNSIKETAFKVMEYFMSLETIKPKSLAKSYDKRK